MTKIELIVAVLLRIALVFIVIDLKYFSSYWSFMQMAGLFVRGGVGGIQERAYVTNKSAKVTLG